jgi:hypothetical protein
LNAALINKIRLFLGSRQQGHIPARGGGINAHMTLDHTSLEHICITEKWQNGAGALR